MHTSAAGAASNLWQAWERPIRHNRRIERAALWNTLILQQDCDIAVTSPRPSIMLPLRVDVKLRYELQAAIHVARANFPFDAAERDALCSHDILGDPEFSNGEAVSREPALFEEWHKWLWLGTEGEPQVNTQALGASAILAEACTRLAEVIPQVLAWD